MMNEASKRLSADDRRGQLLEIGAVMFNTRRYSEISVDDIAAAAGISKGLLYYYFESKKDFFLAGLRQAAIELLSACEVSSNLSYADQMALGIKGFLDYVEEHSFAYLNLFHLFRDESSSLPEVVEVCEEVRQAILDRLVSGALLPRDRHIPATRIALRGFQGFTEAVVLYWLENGMLQRPAIERLVVSSLSNALNTGLTIDFGADSPELKSVEKHLSVVRARFDI